MRARRLLPFNLLLLPLLLAGCSDSPTRPENHIHFVQEVQAVIVSLGPTCPRRVTAEAWVGIGACDTLLPPQVTRDGATVNVRIEVETADVICIAVLYGALVTVDLGDGFAPGTYRVVVNDWPQTETTFVVPEDCG